MACDHPDCAAMRRAETAARWEYIWRVAAEGHAVRCAGILYRTVELGKADPDCEVAMRDGFDRAFRESTIVRRCMDKHDAAAERRVAFVELARRGGELDA